MVSIRQNTLPWAAAAGSILVGVHDALFYWRDVEPGSRISTLWPTMFLLLLVMWVEQDSRAHPEISRPSLDYGLLVYVFWIPYLPYYMWRTRGTRGLALVVTFAILGMLSEILMWGIYVAG